MRCGAAWRDVACTSPMRGDRGAPGRSGRAAPVSVRRGGPDARRHSADWQSLRRTAGAQVDTSKWRATAPWQGKALTKQCNLSATFAMMRFYTDPQISKS